MSNESPWSAREARRISATISAAEAVALAAVTPPFDTIVLMQPVRLLDSPADTFAGKAGPFGPPGRPFWIATRRDRTRVIVDFEPHVDDWRLYVRAEFPWRSWSLKA